MYTTILNKRKIHGLIGPIFASTLILTAITGFSYRWFRNAFHYPKENVDWLLEVHQGKGLLQGFELFYTLFNAVGIFALLFTGYGMIRQFFWKGSYQRRIPRTSREFHQKLSSIVLIPLGISAFTGVLYRYLTIVFGYSHDEVGVLMFIHQGDFLLFTGANLVYTFIVGVGLLSMAISGLFMWSNKYQVSKSISSVPLNASPL